MIPELVYFVVGLTVYLVGAIPFGFLAVKWIKGIDLRTVGSGNIGATNAARALGTAWFFPIFALDFLKGFAPVFWLAPWVVAKYPCDHCPFLPATMAAYCGLAAVAGHLFPIYLHFKGGKAVATGVGMVMAVNWLAGAAVFGVFLAIFLASRYVSLGSMVGALALPPAHLLTAEKAGWRVEEKWVLMVVLSLFALFVVFRHRQNWGRIRRGEEPKVRLWNASR